MGAAQERSIEMKAQGLRGLIITLAALTVFGFVAWKSPNADFMTLGLGIAAVVAPSSVRAWGEYKFKNGDAKA